MVKLWAAVSKELLLLWRDRAGLAVLFLMPVILVVAITLVQKNVMELTGQSKARLLMADLDKGSLGKALSASLEEGHVAVICQDGEETGLEDIRAAVLEGDFQVGIVVPAGSSKRLYEEATALFTESEQVALEGKLAQIPIFLFLIQR